MPKNVVVPYFFLLADVPESKDFSQSTEGGYVIVFHNESFFISCFIMYTLSMTSESGLQFVLTFCSYVSEDLRGEFLFVR